MSKKIISILVNTSLEGEKIKGCFYCPLKWKCAICLYKGNRYMFNHGCCDCTKESYICLNEPMLFDTQLLKNIYVEGKLYKMRK